MNIQKIIKSLITIAELGGRAGDDEYLRGYRHALEAISSIASESVSSSSVSGRLSSENPRFPARSDEYAIASVSRGVLGEDMTDAQWNRFKELMNQESFDNTFADIDPVIDDCYARATGESPEENQ